MNYTSVNNYSTNNGLISTHAYALYNNLLKLSHYKLINY